MSGWNQPGMPAITPHYHRMNCKLASRCHGSVAILSGRQRALLPVVAALMLLAASVVAFGQAAALDSASKPGVRSKPSTKDAVATKAAPAKTEIGNDWVRVQYGDDGKPVGMQTAIVRYATKAKPDGASAPPIVVDLIGAVHVGDVSYYRQLNQHFKQYDALLYELVAPEGTVVERGRGTSNAHPVGAMQNGIKSLLELDHQLEEIDYTRPNFVHADMSPDQFVQAMKDRNESFLQMYFRLLGNAMAHQSELTANGQSLDIELFAALFAKDRPRRLKMALAKQLAEMESLMVSFGGEEGSVIISERNKMALKVLKEQLAAGKRKLGIFYGAGHLNDMDERLRKDFQLEPVSISWLTAWNLTTKP
jgi:hypothetical protein